MPLTSQIKRDAKSLRRQQSRLLITVFLTVYHHSIQLASPEVRLEVPQA